MANINETNHWSETIYEIATTDDVIGGVDGISNIQANQLASRTNYLKTQINDLETGKQSAGQAVQLTTARLININGDATGNASFDGASDVSIHITQQDSGVHAGRYRQVDVDAKGRVIDGSNPTTLEGYGITDAASIHFVQQAVLPAGTRMPFAQKVAPTGWTQVNDDETYNRLLRVVNGVGGKVGGVHSPVLNNVVPAHTHRFTTGNISADHTHVIHDPGHTHGVIDPGHSHVNVAGDAGSGSNLGSGNDNRKGSRSGGGIAATGISLRGSGTGIWNGGVTSNHTHSGATDNGSSQTNWQPRYVDLIICVKN